MAAPTIVQSRIGNGFPLDSLAFLSNVTAGNLLVVCYGNRNLDPATVTVGDTQTNSYTRQAASGVTSLNASIWTAVAGSSGACTVNFTSGGSNNNTVVILEISGQAASFVDQVVPDSNGNDNAPVGDLPVTTYAEDLLIGFMRTTNTAQTITATNGYTTVQERESDECASCISQTTSSTGNYDPTWTTTNTPFWTVTGIAIKGAAVTNVTWFPVTTIRTGPAYRVGAVGITPPESP